MFFVNQQIVNIYNIFKAVLDGDKDINQRLGRRRFGRDRLAGKRQEIDTLGTKGALSPAWIALFCLFLQVISLFSMMQADREARGPGGFRILPHAPTPAFYFPNQLFYLSDFHFSRISDS